MSKTEIIDENEEIDQTTQTEEPVEEIVLETFKNIY